MNNQGKGHMRKKPRFTKKQNTRTVLPRVPIRDIPDELFGTGFSILKTFLHIGIAITAAIQGTAEETEKETEEVQLPNTCYRCGKKLQGTWLTMPIDGKDRTVCANNCKSK